MSVQTDRGAAVSTQTANRRQLWLDFAVLGIWAALLALLFALGVHDGILGGVRAVLGVGFVLFVPGYCLTAAIFPASSDLEWPARLGASVGLSVATVPLLALLLDWLPWGIFPWPILLAEYVFAAICIVIAMLRRSRLAPGAEAIIWPTMAPGEIWTGLRPVGRQRAILVGALVLFLLAGTWFLLAPSSDKDGTAFYMLGSTGQARDFPRAASPGQTLSVTLGIANAEGSAHSYRVELWAADPISPTDRVKIAEQATLEIAPGQSSERPIEWQMPVGREKQQVEFLLYIDGAADPARNLLLPLDGASR